MDMKYEEGHFWVTPHETDPNLLIVASKSRATLESMLTSIELAGVGDGYDFDDLAIYLAESGTLYAYYESIIDRAGLERWFSFELKYYFPSQSELF